MLVSERVREADIAPGPASRRASVDHWRTRGGLVLAVALTLGSAAVVVLLVGRGAASAIAALRGPGAVPAATQVTPPVNTPVAPAQPTSEPTAQTAAPTTAAGAAQATPQATPQATAQVTPQATQQATPQVTPQATVRPAPTAAAQRREHTIAPGDTLSGIAQRYGTTVDALVAANGLANRNVTLQVGRRLVVPG